MGHLAITYHSMVQEVPGKSPVLVLRLPSTSIWPMEEHPMILTIDNIQGVSTPHLPTYRTVILEMRPSIHIHPLQDHLLVRRHANLAISVCLLAEYRINDRTRTNTHHHRIKSIIRPDHPHNRSAFHNRIKAVIRPGHLLNQSAIHRQINSVVRPGPLPNRSAMHHPQPDGLFRANMRISSQWPQPDGSGLRQILSLR